MRVCVSFGFFPNIISPYACVAYLYITYMHRRTLYYIHRKTIIIISYDVRSILYSCHIHIEASGNNCYYRNALKQFNFCRFRGKISKNLYYLYTAIYIIHVLCRYDESRYGTPII